MLKSAIQPRSLTLRGTDMDRNTAIKKLTRLLGKRLAWRVNPKAYTPEEREAAKAAFPAAAAERKRLTEQREARYQAILAADAEYQSLREQEREARKRAEHLSGVMMSRKISVGLDTGLFFHVKAEGDSWEEVIGKLTPEKVAA
jgi:PHD/YefM family antitoxin component YafN of YafNO toxin-antitoxin module